MAPIKAEIKAAIEAALNAALAGDGFEGGDFDGLDPKAFEAALHWIADHRVPRPPRRRPRRDHEAQARYDEQNPPLPAPWWHER